MGRTTSRKGNNTWIWIALVVVALVALVTVAVVVTRSNPLGAPATSSTSAGNTAAGGSPATGTAGGGGSSTPKTETKNVELQGATSLTATIEVLSGALKVSGGAPSGAAMAAEFQGDVARPKVSYSVADGVGDLSVSQQASGASPSASSGDWAVRLASDVESTLAIRVGAGDSGLALGDLDLKSLEVTAGAGQIDMDLTGGKVTRLDGYVLASSGKLSITMPKGKSVRVDVAGPGTGVVTARGLTKGADGIYRTPGTSGETADISFRIDRGSGAVELIAP
jgi:hypothetical protein